MIDSDAEYEITKGWIERFTEARQRSRVTLQALGAQLRRQEKCRPEGVKYEWDAAISATTSALAMEQIHMAAYQSEIGVLQEQLREYDAVRELARQHRIR